VPDPRSVIRTYISRNMLFSDGSYGYADEASFLDEGIVDSMNVMELVAFVTEQFAIQVEDHEIVPDNFDSVARLAAFVVRKRCERPPAATDASHVRSVSDRSRVRPASATITP